MDCAGGEGMTCNCKGRKVAFVVVRVCVCVCAGLVFNFLQMFNWIASNRFIELDMAFSGTKLLADYCSIFKSREREKEREEEGKRLALIGLSWVQLVLNRVWPANSGEFSGAKPPLNDSLMHPKKTWNGLPICCEEVTASSNSQNAAKMAASAKV